MMQAMRRGALILSLAAAALAPAVPAGAFEGTVELRYPPGHAPSEPHIAVNPANPANAAVVVHDDQARAETPLGAAGIRAFATFDGGASWADNLVLTRSFEDRRAGFSDPVAAFGPTGTAYYSSLALLFGRRSLSSLVVTGRSDDGGLTYPEEAVLVRDRSSQVLPEDILSKPEREAKEESGRRKRQKDADDVVEDFGPEDLVVNDKEWIAVDQTGGPFRGSVYASWDRIKGDGQELLFTRSADGGQSFTRPVRLSGGINIAPQLVVRPDGTLDLVWLKISIDRRRERLRLRLAHAASTDGGTSFARTQEIAAWRSGDVGTFGLTSWLPTLAVDARGRLTACWAQESNRGRSLSTRCTSSADGVGWTPAAPVSEDVTRGEEQALPAIAAQGETFWLMVYESGRRDTRVLLYRSDDGGITWARHDTLAERDFGSDKVGFPGHYVGLAATPTHVLGAYVLGSGQVDREDPGGSDEENRLYVTSVPTR